MVSFPDQPVPHAARRLVIVPWPAAIEIDLDVSFRLSENAFKQIVPQRERAGERDLAEDFGPLPAR